MSDPIDRQVAIDALWKALYAYEDKTERQFIESDELDVCDWIEHRAFVQNMSDIDRQTILELPSAERRGHWIYTPTNLLGYVCSECGKAMCRFDYCPHCGARMDGE